MPTQQPHTSDPALDAYPIGLFTLDADGIVISANTCAMEILACLPEALIGRPLFLHIDTYDQSRYLAALERIEAGGVTFESLRIATGEDTRWVQFHLTATGNRHTPRHFTGACVLLPTAVPNDINQMVRDEHLRMLLDYSSDIMIIMALDGQTLYITPNALHRISGYTVEEYLSHDLFYYTHPDDLRDLLPLYEEWQRNPPDEAVVVCRLLSKSGEYRWMEARTRAVVDSRGVAAYQIQISRDISQVKELEFALRERTEALERATRLKDEFLATMSHELRTPLAAILGLAEAMQAGIGGRLSEEQLGMIGTLEESGQHLLTLINDVLDLSKIEAGRLELHYESIDVQDCCLSALRLVREMAHTRHIQLHFSPDPSVMSIQADARRIKQMLVNLFSNAIKFTPEGGEVGLTVTGDSTNGVVRLMVWDTGIGIAPDEHHKLFEPFTQVQQNLARQYEGSGLGLSLVKRMVELHGGSITVESTPGLGSRFTLCFPWAETDDEIRIPDVSIPHNMTVRSQKATVLLAEDNAILANLLTTYLARYGYQLVVARNGHEVLHMITTCQPDIILMDILMPELDGLATTQQLRAMPKYASTPIIAVTALTMPGDRERCLAAGMNDFLTKPLSLETLHATIEAYL